jgi:hypothetical protein
MPACHYVIDIHAKMIGDRLTLAMDQPTVESSAEEGQRPGLGSKVRVTRTAEPTLWLRTKPLIAAPERCPRNRERRC